MPYKNEQDRIANSKRYYIKNRETIKKKVKKYYYENWTECNERRNRWSKNNYEKFRTYLNNAAKRYRQLDKNRIKLRAHWAVKYAIKTNRLIRPRNCQLCGNTGRIEGHHHLGYNKENRLNVIWLCSPCHKREEKILKNKHENIFKIHGR